MYLISGTTSMFHLIQCSWWSLNRYYYPPCPGNVDVRYALPDSCMSYIQCKNGHRIMKHCIGRGLFLFDRVRLQCALRWNVNCSADATNPLNRNASSLLDGFHYFFH